MMMVTSTLSVPCSDHTVRLTVHSGKNYCVDSSPGAALVTPALARELEHVLELFGREVLRGCEKRVGIYFKPGIFGHHKVGRAADIYGVGGVGLDVWKRLWDEALQRVSQTNNVFEKQSIMNCERRTNLGWRLYKMLQLHGRWCQPAGYPVQLFGPWTRSEGPWKPISDFLLNAHRDHVHVAK